VYPRELCEAQSSKLFFDWRICDATHIVPRFPYDLGHRVIICEAVNSPPVRALASAKPRPNIGFRYATWLGQVTQSPSTEGGLRYYLCLETKSNFPRFFVVKFCQYCIHTRFFPFYPLLWFQRTCPPKKNSETPSSAIQSMTQESLQVDLVERYRLETYLGESSASHTIYSPSIHKEEWRHARAIGRGGCVVHLEHGPKDSVRAVGYFEKGDLRQHLGGRMPVLTGKLLSNSF